MRCVVPCPPPVAARTTELAFTAALTVPNELAPPVSEELMLSSELPHSPAAPASSLATV